MDRRLTATAITACAFAAAGLLAAPAPPPQPPRVAISDVSTNATRTRFTITFSPVAGYRMYQFTTDPKPNCKYATAVTVPGKGPFVAQSYPPAGPFRTAVDCACGTKTLVAMVAVASPDGYTPRSKWTNSAAIDNSCPPK